MVLGERCQHFGRKKPLPRVIRISGIAVVVLSSNLKFHLECAAFRSLDKSEALACWLTLNSTALVKNYPKLAKKDSRSEFLGDLIVGPC